MRVKGAVGVQQTCHCLLSTTTHTHTRRHTHTHTHTRTRLPLQHDESKRAAPATAALAATHRRAPLALSWLAACMAIDARKRELSASCFLSSGKCAPA
jgi:hypothetical protein